METIEIDARAMEEKELLLRLRDLFQEHAEEEISLSVLVKNPHLARRVKTFCDMSRLSCAVAADGESCSVFATGSPCRCG